METTKKTRKFNIVDVLIILVVIAAAVVVVYKFGGKKIVESTNTQQYKITYTVSELLTTTAESIHEGDKLTDFAGNVNLGTVTGINLENDSHSYAANSEGKYVMSARDGYCYLDIIGTVDASKQDNGISVNGTSYLIGHSITLEAGDAKVYALITGIEEVTAAK